jgi:hypothetical protein
VDLWGRLGANYDVPLGSPGQRAGPASTALSLIGTTANLYWTGAYLNQRIRTAEQSIAYAQKTLELVRHAIPRRRRLLAGSAEAQQNLLSQQSSHTELVQQQVENDNALAILFDSPPGQSAPCRRLPSSLAGLEAGLPAELLARRPDLRAAELRLREALASVDLTRTNFYPQLTLTGTLGTSSDALLRLVQNPVARWRPTEPALPAADPDEAQGRRFTGGLRQRRGRLPPDPLQRLQRCRKCPLGTRAICAQQALLARNVEVAQAAERSTSCATGLARPPCRPGWTSRTSGAAPRTPWPRCG